MQRLARRTNPLLKRTSSWIVASGLVLSSLVLTALAQAADLHAAGAKVYRDQCASCHGKNGEGVRNKYADPLVGDRSLASLIRYIDRQMPEDKPDGCSEEEAKQVSAYIYENFYSLEAQLRTNQPRVELSRLTVNQYQNTIADLLASFNGYAKPVDKFGLHAEYFNDGRGFNGKQRVIDQTEAILDVRFEGKKPSDKIDKEDFAVRWSGAVFAPEDGEYEFILDTPNGARLWVNDREKPLIDVWVRSGTETKHRANIRLLAGRTYYLKAEVGKEKKETLFAAQLRWKVPHHPETIIPERLLSPDGGSQFCIVQTPFPPDDNSLGYERGATISKAWDEATTLAAFEVANYVIEKLQRYAGVRIDAGDAKAKSLTFLRTFVERAYREPLSEDTLIQLVNKPFEQAENIETGIKTVLLQTLKSPRFLYIGITGKAQDPYVIASKISYGLWDSLPDTFLLAAAKQGWISKPEEVLKNIDRLLADPRAKAKLKRFYHRWLKVDELHGLEKNGKKFPGFDDAMVSELRTSLDLFVEDVMWSDQSDYRQLFTTNDLFLNGRLAKYYGIPADENAPFGKYQVADQPRAGILTHPLLMAGLAYSETSSPIHRGVFVSRNLLGRRLRSPPDSIVPESPTLNPKLSTRERISKQTKPSSCQSCHDMINPLGFTMEHFDAVGRYRAQEDTRPIDASGGYLRQDGEQLVFTNARDLGKFLIDSPEAQAAFVERLFKDTIKQPILAYGPNEKERLRQYFVANNFHMRKLLGEMLISATFASTNTSATTTTVPSTPKQVAKP